MGVAEIYTTESFYLRDLKDLQVEWVELQARANCTFFQSWGWIGTWLEKIALELRPLVVKVSRDDRLAGLGIFVTRRYRRRGIFVINAMFLNELPFGTKNMVIEYNGLLAEAGREEQVYRSVIMHLRDKFTEIDEFNFGAVAEKDYNVLSRVSQPGLNITVNDVSVCRYINLDSFEKTLDSYLACLSKNTRWQIRRSIKEYNKNGQICLEEAGDAKEISDYFHGLKQLHTSRWQSKGCGGTFSNPLWEAFHRALIENRFDKREIQLLKIFNDQKVIGYLYNLIWRNRVFVIQMGFGDSMDRKHKPGYVSHVMAIMFNKEKEMEAYDFMHGDAQYKDSLSNNALQLYWVVVQRKKLKFILERILVKIVRAYRDL